MERTNKIRGEELVKVHKKRNANDQTHKNANPLMSLLCGRRNVFPRDENGPDKKKAPKTDVFRAFEWSR